jgi:hypothetical protein
MVPGPWFDGLVQLRCVARTVTWKGEPAIPTGAVIELIREWEVGKVGAKFVDRGFNLEDFGMFYV